MGQLDARVGDGVTPLDNDLLLIPTLGPGLSFGLEGSQVGKAISRASISPVIFGLRPGRGLSSITAVTPPAT